MSFERTLQKVLGQFADYLESRFLQKVPTTEDAVRYSFFAALLKNGFQPEDIILEGPHPNIDKAQVDTVIPSFESQSVFVEFKYDRELSNSSNRPRPQQAGALFKDVFRLLQIPESLSRHRYLIYVTDDEMVRYMKNKDNGLSEFFNLLPGHSLKIYPSFFRERSNTFQNAVGAEYTAELAGIFSKNLCHGNCIRIFEVLPLE